MRKKILLLMNCYEREQFIAEMIKDEILKIEDAECKVLYWNRGIHDKDIYRFAPNVLMIFPLTILPLIRLVARVKVMSNPTVVSFVTEGYINTDYLNEKWLGGYYDFAPELVDFWCVWGEKYGDYLWNVISKEGKIKYRENIKVFGYPLWEHDHLQEIKAANDCEKKILKLIEKSNKTILILSGFMEANKSRNDVINSIDAYDETSDEKDIQVASLVRQVEKLREYREKYYSLIMAMIEENPDMTFLIKLHPKEIEGIRDGKGYDYSVFSKWNNIEVLAEDNLIGMYINKVDAVIHYGSTVAWEAYVCDIPAMKIDSGDNELKYYFGTYVPGECYDLKEKEEILDWVKNLDEKKPEKAEYEEYVKDFFNYDRNQEYSPSRALARFLCEHCDSPQYSIEKYVRCADVNNGFRKSLLKEGMLDMLSFKLNSGVHKIGLAFNI